MKAINADQEFQAFAVKSGRKIEEISPDDALDLMINFYENVRAEDCDLEADGDMLLFQWGVYDWGQGEHFSLDITRQFIFPGELDEEDGEDCAEDDQIWQLSLTLKYPPLDVFRALESGNKWCSLPAEAKSFREFVHAYDATRAAADQSAFEVSLRYGCAG